VSLGHNVLRLTIAKIASTAVLFVVTPIVTRIFLPEDFGTQQIFSSILGVLSVVVCLRYDMSIPIGRDDRESSISFAVSAIISLAFSLFVLVAVFFARGQLAVLLKCPALDTLLWLLPIAVLIVSWRQCLRYWASYKMQFRIIALAGFLAVVVSVLMPIGWFFVFGRSPAGLLVALVAGNTIALLVFLIPLFGSLLTELKGISLRGIIDVVKYHKQFPIYSTWSGLINSLFHHMPTFFLSTYFASEVVGYYSLGNRMVTLPISLLAISIKQVFYPMASKEYQKTGDISNIIRRSVRRLAQLGVFPMVMIGFCGARLFGGVFGRQWIEAGVYAQILSITGLSHFVVSPLLMIFAVKPYQSKALIYNATLTSSSFMALFLSSYMNNPRLTLTAYAITGFIVYALTFLWLLHLSNVSVRWGLNVVLKYTLGSVVLLLPTLFFIYCRYNTFFIIASLFFETAIYLFILCKTDVSLRTGIGTIFHGVRSQIKHQNKD